MPENEDRDSSAASAAPLEKGQAAMSFPVFRDRKGNRFVFPAVYVSHADNSQDMVDRGRSTRGERSGNAKLNPAAVLYIRNSDASCAALATRYGVTPMAVWRARVGKTWPSESIAPRPEGNPSCPIPI